MDIATSSVTMLTSVFSSFWQFVTSNRIILIMMMCGLVGTCISLFMSIKSRLTCKK